MKLRMSNEGNAGIGGGPRGDLFVVVNVKDHDLFEREGNDLFFEISVPVTQLVLGTSVRIPILDGRTDLKIPSGTQSGTKFRLKGKGIKNIKGFGQGDMYVIVNVDIPTSISKEEKTYFESRATARNDKSRLDQNLESLI